MSHTTKTIGAVGIAAGVAAAAGGGGRVAETLFVADSGNAALRGSTAGTRTLAGAGTFDFPTGPILPQVHIEELYPRIIIDEIPKVNLDQNIAAITIDEIPKVNLGRGIDEINTGIVGTSDSYGSTTIRSMKQIKPRSTSAAISNDVINNNSHKTSIKISTLFKRAEPQILNDLGANAGRLTKSGIEKIVSDELTKTVAKAASQPNSGITFEVLTGKLTIDSSGTVFGITLTGGAVNVYKVSTTLAAGIVACEALAAPELKKCAKAALAKVGSAVAQELKLEPNSSKESSNK